MKTKDLDKKNTEIYKKLTIKQQRFIDEYLKTGNGKEATIKAGYRLGSKHNPTKDKIHTTNTASAIAYENLKKPHIAIAIEDNTRKAMERIKNSSLKNVIKAEQIRDKTDKDELKFQVIKDLLDRAGVRQVDKSVRVNLNADISNIPD